MARRFRRVAAGALGALALAGGGAAAQAPTEPPPSSYVLIDRALAAKQITEEKAFVYRAFAAFGDTRLPSQYRGVDRFVEPPRVVSEARKRFRTFSVQTQAELAPFLKRPASPGSWVSLPTAGGQPEAAPPRDDNEFSGPSDPGGLDRAPNESAPTAIEWFSVRAAGGKARVWAQLRHAGDSLKAEQIARQLTSTIWPKLVGLFWEPLGDDGLEDNGGGAEVDIYLVRPVFGPNVTPWKGQSEFADPVRQCGDSPHYILIDSRRPIGGATSVGLLQTVTHELTHAITGRKALRDFNCAEYEWIREATAVWAEDWVYPQAQSEHEEAPFFLRDPRVSLDGVSTDPGDRHHYGAYLLPFYLANKGQQRAMPTMWENFATRRSLPGVDAALRVEAGEPLEKVFPKFAIQNWNRPSVDDYKQSDNLNEVANLGSDSIKVTVPAGGRYERRIATGIKYLAAEYVYFDFQIDGSVRLVTFENTLAPVKFASVWGIEKIKGVWQKPIDFGATPNKTWCRDVAAEDIEALVVIITNNQWENKQLQVEARPNNPLLSAYRTGCPGWNGSTTMTNTIVSRDPPLTIVETVSSTMRFEIDSALISPGQPPQYWKVTAGQLTWKAQLTGQCTGSGSGTLGLRDFGPGEEAATLQIYDDNGTMRYMGTVGPWPGEIPSYVMTCPNSPPQKMILFGALGWFVTDGVNNKVSADGKSISGTTTGSPGPGITTTHRYTFRAP